MYHLVAPAAQYKPSTSSWFSNKHLQIMQKLIFIGLVHELLFYLGLSRPLFYFRLFYKQLPLNLFNKTYQWRDSNPGPLVSEATTLSTAPQPQPPLGIWHKVKWWHDPRFGPSNQWRIKMHWKQMTWTTSLPFDVQEKNWQYLSPILGNWLSCIRDRRYKLLRCIR